MQTQNQQITAEAGAESDFAPEVQQLDAIQQLLAIAEKLRALCPLPDPERGNYISMSAGGYKRSSHVHVFFGEGCTFDVQSVAELRVKLQAYNKAKLETQLAELEGKQ